MYSTFLLGQLQANSSTSGAAPSTAQSLLVVSVEVIAVIFGIAVVGTVLTRLVGSVAMRAGASKYVASSARQWIAVLMIVAAAASVAGLTGLSSQYATLTLSGIGGLAVTLALQTTLSNIISGLLMLQDGVLRLGDEIEFGTVRGDVVKLSLRTTWVKTKDGVIAVIGNTNLASGPVLNHSARARLEKKLQV